MNRFQRRASESHGRSLVAKGWSKFEDITYDAMTRPSFRQMSCPPCIVMANNVYIVQIWLVSNTEWGRVTQVGIRRNDAAPVHSWNDLFRIKNEIFGPERSAVEVYPAVSELVDDANMYWLFVLDEGKQPPFTIRRRA